jgi:hypothetical protein
MGLISYLDSLAIAIFNVLRLSSIPILARPGLYSLDIPVFITLVALSSRCRNSASFLEDDGLETVEFHG